MAELRTASGVSLKRIYQLYPGKDDIVVDVLARREERWQGELAQVVAAAGDPAKRVAAVFDWLYEWFTDPAFRGSPWNNAFGELSGISPAAAEEARRHADAFRRYLRGLVTAAGGSKATADAVFLLAEGAIVSAAVEGSPKPAKRAKKAAQALLATDA
jgi:AcrR family transcriptional regulator